MGTPTRHKGVVGIVADRWETLMAAQTAILQLEAPRIAIQPDYVHVFVSADPDLAPSTMVERITGVTARVACKCPDLLKLCFKDRNAKDCLFDRLTYKS